MKSPYLSLLIIILLLSCGNANSFKKKRITLPEGLDNKKEETYKSIKRKYGDLNSELTWKLAKNTQDNYFFFIEDYTFKNKYNSWLQYHENGLIRYKGQKLLGRGQIFVGEGGDLGYGERQFNFGRYSSFFSNGNFEKISCYSPIDTAFINLADALCGTETHYNEDGTVKETINHPRKCTMGCGEFTPYLDEGEKYKVDADEIKVHKEPNAKSEVIATLKKGTVFKIKEDTKKIEEIGENIAPWGNIGFGFMNMSSGYIYGSGSFVSGPYN